MKFYLAGILLLGILFNNTNCGDTKKMNNMLTYKECLDLAKQKLKEVAKDHIEYIIWEEKTITKEYGWVFIPSTENFIKTGNKNTLVPGISSIIVNKFDSTCFMIPSYRPSQFFIQEYEKELENKQSNNE